MTHREKLYRRIAELVRAIEAMGYTVPNWQYIGKAHVTDEAIIVFGKRLRAIHDIYAVRCQIKAIGYSVDEDMSWTEKADQEELQAFLNVQRDYLVWCQQQRRLKTTRDNSATHGDITAFSLLPKSTVSVRDMSK